MLEIKTPYVVGDTVTIKTTTGDELVTRLVKVEKDTITVKKPLALAATEKGMMLAPYVFTVGVDTDLELNRNVIVFIAKTEKTMASKYIESTTGIKT